METDELNGVYYPLYIKANEILKRFVPSRIFEAEYGWYNGHYSKNQSGQYVMDYFPIPVVSVKGFCDIEIGIGQITVSTKLRVLISNCVNDRIRQEFPTTAFVIISIKKSKSRLK